MSPEKVEMSSHFEIYSGKSVLITGHTGFKGSWLALWLSMLGAKVTGLSLGAPTVPSHFEAAHLQDLLVRDVRGDIRDELLVNDLIGSTKPDFIFHLAAQPLVHRSLISPRETFDVNVVGTASVLDAVKNRLRNCVVVVATSDKCYKNEEVGKPFVESDPLGGHDPYSASKAGTELVIEAYRTSFFSSDAGSPIRLSSVRAGNVIGGGDWGESRIVPDAVRAISEQKVLEVRNPRSIRPWQHVLDPLSGYLHLASMMALSQTPDQLCSAWNFGPQQSEGVSVQKLLEKLFEVWGSGSWAGSNSDYAGIEAKTLSISIEKAKRELNWQPTWDIDTSISQTAKWYRKFYSDPSQSMYESSRECIGEFTRSLNSCA